VALTDCFQNTAVKARLLLQPIAKNGKVHLLCKLDDNTLLVLVRVAASFLGIEVDVDTSLITSLDLA
jgi:hypothetical protein